MHFSTFYQRISFFFGFFALLFSFNFVLADGHMKEKSHNIAEGWFYIGEFNHDDNRFQMSYFNAKNYPVLGQRLIANRAVNQRATAPTNKGQLGKINGIILKNHVLIVTELVKGSAPNGIEDVWVKGYVETVK